MGAILAVAASLSSATGGGGGAIVNPLTLNGNFYTDQGIAGSDPTSSATLTMYTNGTWGIDGFVLGPLDNNNWYSPLSAGIGTSYWVKFTLNSTSGSSTNTTWTTTTGWLQLNANRSCYVLCTSPSMRYRTANYTVQISSNSLGTVIVSTSTVDLTATLV